MFGWTISYFRVSAPPESEAELAPVDVTSAVWRHDLRSGGEVQFVGRREADSPSDSESSTSTQLLGPKLVTLGPLDATALAACKLRVDEIAQVYRLKEMEFLTEPIPDDRALQEEWQEKALAAHYLARKSELAAKAFAAGDYWVFEPGERTLPKDIAHIDLFGVRAHGRDNVTVVVPLSLREHPELESLSRDWEEFLRYRARLFAEEFNRRSLEERVASIAQNDDVGRRIAEINAQETIMRETGGGLTEEDVSRFHQQRVEVRRSSFPQYCIVDRTRSMLYVDRSR